MPAVGKALIVGGGIGGLTAATALGQKGIAVDLVELQPALSVYGVGIIQPNNMLRALAKIGLADICVANGAAFPGWRIFDQHGHHLMDAPGGSDADPRYPPTNGITRPKLHEILTDAARMAGAVIRTGVSVADFDDDGEGVTVRFTDGNATRYDLVVASDGLHSQFRKQLFPDAPAPIFTGQGVWRYNLPRPSDLEWAALFFGPDTKVGLVPMTHDLMYMLIVTYDPDNPFYAGDQMANLMRDRLHAYTGTVADLKELIVDPAQVVYRPMEQHLLPAPWYVGRTIVIGDAAHGTTPHLNQGASLAVEDAVLLGELLGDDAPVPDVLATFMERRFQRASFVVNSSLQIGKWEIDDWLGIASPDANPGALLHDATHALMADY